MLVLGLQVECGIGFEAPSQFLEVARGVIVALAVGSSTHFSISYLGDVLAFIGYVAKGSSTGVSLSLTGEPDLQKLSTSKVWLEQGYWLKYYGTVCFHYQHSRLLCTHALAKRSTQARPWERLYAKRQTGSPAYCKPLIL